MEWKGSRIIEPNELVGKMVRTTWPAVVLVALGGLVLLAFVSPTLGGDSTTLVFPTEERIETAPGDTVEVELLVASDGGYDQQGLESVTVVASYDTEYVEFVDAAPEPWLAGDDGSEVTTDVTVDEGAGNVTIEQRRDPPGNGVTGNETFATLTFEIAEDAPEAKSNVTFEHSEARLVGDYFIYVYDTNATLAIDEDAGTTESAGDGAETPAESDATGGEPPDQGGSGLDPFGIAAVVGAVGLGAVVLGLGLRRRI